MAPKKEKDKPPEVMTINGQECRRMKDATTGKFVYRPVAQPDDAAGKGSDSGSAAGKGQRTVEDEKKWLQRKEKEIQELRVRESQQQSIEQRRMKEKVGLIEKVPSRRREPKVPVPATLRKLREEIKAAATVGMQATKPSQYAIIKEALEIEESRYQAKVKEAKERAYKKTRGQLRVTGADGLNDSGSEDDDAEDGALVPKQELHDIDDYRRDYPTTGKLWGSQEAQPGGQPAENPESSPSSRPAMRGGRGRGGGRGRQQLGRGAHENLQEAPGGSMDMRGLEEALPGQSQKRRGRRGGSHAQGGRGQAEPNSNGVEPAQGSGEAPKDGAGHQHQKPAERGRGRGRGGGGRRGRGGRGRGSGSAAAPQPSPQPAAAGS